LTGKNTAVASLSPPNIGALIADGEMAVSVLHPVGCVAAVTD